MKMPPDFATVAPYFIVTGAEACVHFLTAGLGGEETCRTLGAEGRIVNVIVRIGSASVMVSVASEACPAMNASYYLYVEHADAAMARALAQGATLVMSVDDQPYGDRQGGVRDAWGNLWWISQRLVDGPYKA